MHRLKSSLRNATTARALLQSQSRPASNFTPLALGQQTLATVSQGKRLETLHLSSCFKPAKRWETALEEKERKKKRLATFQNFFSVDKILLVISIVLICAQLRDLRKIKFCRRKMTLVTKIPELQFCTNLHTTTYLQ